jgi:hypothetical protein
MAKTQNSPTYGVQYLKNALHAVLIMPNGDKLMALLPNGENNNSVEMRSPCNKYSITVTPLDTEVMVGAVWDQFQQPLCVFPRRGIEEEFNWTPDRVIR